MIERDHNGNTISRNTKRLSGIVRNMTAGTYQRDSVGRIMVDTPKGSIWIAPDEAPRVRMHVTENLTEH